MPEDVLRYDQMVERALRGVVRDALEQTAKHGPLGDHHFYITFRTHQPGVRMAEHIKVRHPDEMTIVLQHQFWDLVVDDDGFSVALSFSGSTEHLRIPFAAITGFADPSAKFGLQFQTIDADELDDEPAPAHSADNTPKGEESGKVVALDAFRKK